MKTNFWNLLVLGTLSSAIAWAQQPAITQVVDGAAYSEGVAQGSVFVVKGTNLSGPGFTPAAAPNYPFLLGNVQIAFTPTAGGIATPALMVYLYNQDGVNQLAAVLPSNVAAGTYDVRVINGSAASAPMRVNVVARKPGIVTAAGNGSGVAQATLAGAPILQRFADVGKIGGFDTRPGLRGERMDLWGTGLGPDRASDAGGSSGDQTGAGAIRVIVAGIEVTPLYAGRSQGFPGLDQIAFNIPPTVGLGCFIPVQVQAGGVLSNSVTISVADGDVCVHPNLTPDMLRKFGSGESSTNGLFVVSSLSVEIPGLSVGGFTLPPSVNYSEAIGGWFSTYNFDQFAESNLILAPSACVAWSRRGSISALAFGQPPRSLDAGATLTGNLPNNSAVTLTKTRPQVHEYNADLNPSGTARILTAGTYRLSGNGGADVGAFSAQVNVPTLTWTNRSSLAAVFRGQNLTVNWTGGGSGLVLVSGFAGRAAAGSGFSAVLNASGFTCVAQASAGTLTVPASITQQMPAVAFDPVAFAGGGNFGIGNVSVLAIGDSQSGRFSAPLTRGGSIDYGLFTYSVGDSKIVNFQ